VSSLEIRREARGKRIAGRQRAGVSRPVANAAVGTDGVVFPPVELYGLVEPELASELGRQEELYKVVFGPSLG